MIVWTSEDVGNEIRVLLAEWARYNHIYHGKLTNFDDAIAIEYERSYLEMATNKLVRMVEESKYPTDIAGAITAFNQHLTTFKNIIILEILRNGPNG